MNEWMVMRPVSFCFHSGISESRSRRHHHRYFHIKFILYIICSWFCCCCCCCFNFSYYIWTEIWQNKLFCWISPMLKTEYQKDLRNWDRKFKKIRNMMFRKGKNMHAIISNVTLLIDTQAIHYIHTICVCMYAHSLCLSFYASYTPINFMPFSLQYSTKLFFLWHFGVGGHECIAQSFNTMIQNSTFIQIILLLNICALHTNTLL